MITLEDRGCGLPSDEFYTQLTDIENELALCDRSFFKDKIIYCPFDAWKSDKHHLDSAYITYFKSLAEILQFKQLVATCEGYTNNHYTLTRVLSDDVDIVDEYVENATVYVRYEDGHIEEKKDRGLYYYEEKLGHCPVGSGDMSGDFQSAFCQNILNSCDMVITTPASSVFTGFACDLVKRHKMFLICGSQFVIGSNELLVNQVVNQKLWFGRSKKATGFYFRVSSAYKRNNSREVMKSENGITTIKLGYYRWLTNIPYNTTYESLIFLTKEENERKGVVYREYDNIKAINVDNIKNIPGDYDGLMGVPSTFMEYYNPNQFEVLGKVNSSMLSKLGAKKYREGGKLNSFPVLCDPEPKPTAMRLLIRLKLDGWTPFDFDKYKSENLFIDFMDIKLDESDVVSDMGGIDASSELSAAESLSASDVSKLSDTHSSDSLTGLYQQSKLKDIAPILDEQKRRIEVKGAASNTQSSYFVVQLMNIMLEMDNLYSSLNPTLLHKKLEYLRLSYKSLQAFSDNNVATLADIRASIDDIAGFLESDTDTYYGSNIQELRDRFSSLELAVANLSAKLGNNAPQVSNQQEMINNLVLSVKRLTFLMIVGVLFVMGCVVFLIGDLGVIMFGLLIVGVLLLINLFKL